MTARSTWLALGAIAFAAGCSLVVEPHESAQLCDPDPEYADYCGENRSCVRGEDGIHRCQESVVTPDCDDHEDCLMEGSDRPWCLDHECVECFENGHCEPIEGGQHCFEYVCIPGCDEATLEGCPEGNRCIDGQCREPADEECNNQDDDFDGETDEAFDQDGDSVSSCAFVSSVPDCDDTNDEVYPGNGEVCDGVDNDCDRETDEGNICGEGRACDLTTHECIDVDNPCEGESDCGASEFCHEDGLCYPDDVPFGGSCILDSQCQWGRCLSTSTIGPGDRRCTDVCCSSDDCLVGAWCAGDANGLRLCAPAAWYDGQTTVRCGGDDCEACYYDPLFEYCGTTCCGDSECSVGCQVVYDATTPAGTVAATICDARDGSSPFAVGLFEESQCGEVGSIIRTFCSSDVSFIEEYGFPYDTCRCSAPCCSNSDCLSDSGEQGVCAVPLPEIGTSVCVPLGIYEGPGTSDYGDGCTSWADCESGVCHPSLGYCTQTCCPRNPCPDGAVCEPITVGAETANYCTIL